MARFYDLTFFHVYRSLIKSPDDFYKIADKSYPTLVALMVMTFVQLANILAFFLFVDIAGLKTFIFFISLDIGIGIPIVIMAIIYVLNLVIMFNNNRYLKIIKKFSKKPLEERVRGARITLIYGLGSVILVFILAPLRVM